VTRRKNEEDNNEEDSQTEMARIPDSATIEPNLDGQAEFQRVPDTVSVEEVPEAETVVVEALIAPVELVVASDNPLTDENVNQETKLNSPIRASHMTVIYRGSADSFRYGPYKFRPGQPATLPSVIAEELLTYPFEKFEVKE